MQRHRIPRQKGKKKRKRKPSKKRQGFIYGLFVDEGVIRYVGLSFSPGERFLQHTAPIGKSNPTIVQRWAARHKGQVKSVILEATKDVDAAEKKWIRKYRSEGMPLFNFQDGGRSSGSGAKSDVLNNRIRVMERWKLCENQPDKEDYETLQSMIDDAKLRCDRSVHRLEFIPDRYD